MYLMSERSLHSQTHNILGKMAQELELYEAFNHHGELKKNYTTDIYTITALIMLYLDKRWIMLSYANPEDLNQLKNELETIIQDEIFPEVIGNDLMEIFVISSELYLHFTTME
jgi:hypothetical protein